ncbi:adenosylcobinamide-GDP ribazoletransferase [Spongiibacter sp. KMU-166]|uniref:Adenosylcobinamide-GDP ribazoletransferase n=1 Tax=Spongiibacter thalassae TaxID=2721624 RepID=A0ABX1GHI7_9GAMM|nr:adenosylcobinamide-GDP ribazoletransferase [Spongiibacter thalassae]
MSVLKYQWQVFLLALGFLTRIPVPNDPEFSQKKLDGAALYFPAVGLVVGAIAAATYLIGEYLFNDRSVAVLLSMAAGLLLTGAFHEDGLADSLDGFGGGWRRDDVLRIMKDSRIGSYGAAGLFAVLALKAAALMALDTSAQVAAAMIFAHVASRWLAISYLLDLAYVSGEGKSKPLATRIDLRQYLLAGMPVLILLPLLPLQTIVVAALALVVFRLGFAAYLRKRIGGYTGDALGAAQQMGEVLFYLVCLI